MTDHRLLRRGSRGADVERWQALLTRHGFTPGAVDGIFGPNTDAATRSFQARHGLTVDGLVGPQTWGKATELEGSPQVDAAAHPEAAPGAAGAEDPPHPEPITQPTATAETPANPRHVIVLDPGHGGSVPVGGSSPNNAHAPSGTLEKQLTLQLCQGLRQALLQREPALRVELTRSTDENLSLADRARVAGALAADVFISIHFNAFDGVSRGTEAFIRPIAGGNRNHAADKELAQRLVSATVAALTPFDAQARARGVKEAFFGVLRDERMAHGLPKAATRSCLLEVEFLDVRAVDELFTGAQRDAVQSAVCSALADAVLSHLRAAQGHNSTRVAPLPVS